MSFILQPEELEVMLGYELYNKCVDFQQKIETLYSMDILWTSGGKYWDF